MNTTQEMLIRELEKIRIDLPDGMLAKLFNFIDLLLTANKAVNLTAITDYQEALFKHLYDSLIILNQPAYHTAKMILDLGSGAGIPGIPLAICSPEKQFVSLDSVQKKISFQQQTCEKLQINNIQPIWARAEDFINSSGRRQQFDLVLARAVASLNVLVEISLPFVKLSAFALFYKGQNYQRELAEAARALAILGGQLTNIEVAELPLGLGTRALITIQKIQPSPAEYPRKAGIPQKKPL